MQPAELSEENKIGCHSFQTMYFFKIIRHCIVMAAPFTDAGLCF